MVVRGVLCLALLLLAGGVSGAEPQVFEGPRSRIEVPAGTAIDRALVRDIQRIMRMSLSRIVREYDLTTSRVLRFTGGIPAWYRYDEAPGPRILIRVRPGDVTAGAKKLLPAQAHGISRRTALDILHRTVGRGIPLWMESGMADHAADAVLEGASPVVAAYRNDLSTTEFDLEWMALPGETNSVAFERNRGRPLAWGLVAMLDAAGVSRIVKTQYSRSRELLPHLSRLPARLDPQDRPLRKEYTALAREMLTPRRRAVWDPKRALDAWVKAGYPTGPALRDVPAVRRLARIEIPPLVQRVSLTGAVDMPYDENGIKYRIIQNPKVEWTLPWPTRMELYGGFRGLRGTAARYDPDARNKGHMGTCDELRWDAKSSGVKTFKYGVMVRHKPETDRFGFLLLHATSPNGVDYSFFHEWELK